ncbi:MAG: sensor domain-containing protein, partial [Nocardiopsaceae bacterium]|nr:sensor domain-containing protein [Nocardiopsaceae bacterium]
PAAWLGSALRHLAARLLGERVPAAGSGWRATAYLVLKLPVAVGEGYAVIIFWVFGLVNLSFPFWWLSFRNNPPGVRLRPVAVFTPFGWWGQGTYHVSALPGAFAASATGAGMLLAAPWVTRAVVAADRWLIRRLLGPGPLDRRLRDLEQTRALAVDDATARLRRLERDLHDGAQIRLATLALNLGLARKKLTAVPGTEEARELVDVAIQGARDTLAELRELARGIHPPALDNGLADALATLTAGSPVPAELTVDLPARPTPAIEAIAYFCAAELLANAIKHGGASTITIDFSERMEALALVVADDGRGGARAEPGGGLAGLMQRVAVVDGRLEIDSPPGGPTRVTVTLPLSA